MKSYSGSMEYSIIGCFFHMLRRYMLFFLLKIYVIFVFGMSASQSIKNWKIWDEAIKAVSKKRITYVNSGLQECYRSFCATVLIFPRKLWVPANEHPSEWTKKIVKRNKRMFFNEKTLGNRTLSKLMQTVSLQESSEFADAECTFC